MKDAQVKLLSLQRFTLSWFEYIRSDIARAQNSVQLTAAKNEARNFVRFCRGAQIVPILWHGTGPEICAVLRTDPARVERELKELELSAHPSAERALAGPSCDVSKALSAIDEKIGILAAFFSRGFNNGRTNDQRTIGHPPCSIPAQQISGTATETHRIIITAHGGSDAGRVSRDGERHDQRSKLTRL